MCIKCGLVVSTTTEEAWEKKNVGLKTTVLNCVVRKGVNEKMTCEQSPEERTVSSDAKIWEVFQVEGTPSEKAQGGSLSGRFQKQH